MVDLQHRQWDSLLASVASGGRWQASAGVDVLLLVVMVDFESPSGFVLSAHQSKD